MKDLFRLIRPKQWLKNVFVLVPIFFSGHLMDADCLYAGLVTFVAFSMIASSVYCFNDIIDVEADRRHPVKCSRPIASGAISLKQAYGLMALMLALSMVALLFLQQHYWKVLLIILGYYVLNLAYCAELKQHAIVDVCVIAFGFVLRLLAGGFATGIVLSRWIVLMTFLITLFMSFGKRRDDVIRMNDTGEAPRKNTIRYNVHRPGHHHHGLGDASVLHYVYGFARGYLAVTYPLSLSDHRLCVAGTVALHSADGRRQA